MTPLTTPGVRTRELFAMTLVIERMLGFGGDPNQRLATVRTGAFAGGRLAGTVLPGGTDWQRIDREGAVEIDARLALETCDGALIGMTYKGLRTANVDVLAKIERGEPVDPADVYFRITARFATSDPRYAWLGSVLAVGIGERLPEGPRYAMYEVI